MLGCSLLNLYWGVHFHVTYLLLLSFYWRFFFYAISIFTRLNASPSKFRLLAGN